MSDSYPPSGPWRAQPNYQPGQPGADGTVRINQAAAHVPQGPRPPLGAPGGPRQQAPGGPSKPSRPSGPNRGWALKALGLVLVAVVSGMLWWLILQAGSGGSAQDQTTTSSQRAGKYSFVVSDQVPKPLEDSDCAKQAYGKIKDFLTDNPCQGLTRALYTTTVQNHEVYTSISIVQMPDAAKAKDLKKLTDQDKTGNVNDLIKQGRVKVDGLKSLGDGGYASEQRGLAVVIVESDWAPGGARSDAEKALLKEVSRDAIRLADEIRK